MLPSLAVVARAALQDLQHRVPAVGLQHQQPGRDPQGLPQDVEGALDVVQDGAEIQNSILRGPLIIGARTRVSDSYVGPFTAIDHDCVLESVEIANSIVLEHSRIIDIEHRIEDSLIGRYAQVHRSPVKPRAYKLLLGDHSKVVVL